MRKAALFPQFRSRSEICVVKETAHESTTVVWPSEVSVPPFFVRLSFIDHRRRRLHPTSAPAFILRTTTQVLLWPLVVLFGAYPVTVLLRGPIRRWRRRRQGLCPRCGYNLTGNVTGVCPECGEPI